LYSIAEAIKRGVEVYDFMRGTERYKYDFNGVDQTNWTILLYPDSAKLSAQKFKTVLLIDSMKRRAIRERLLWSQVSKEERAHSGGLAAHVVRRIRTNVKDGLHKLRSPEKSLTVDEQHLKPPTEQRGEITFGSPQHTQHTRKLRTT
jgi:hypothetical protein